MLTNHKFKPLLALLLTLPLMSIGNLFVLVVAPGTTLGSVVTMICRVGLVTIPLIWLLLVERQKISWSKPERGGFGMAAGLGLVIAVSILLAYWLVARQGWIDENLIKEVAAKNRLNEFWVYMLGAVYWVTINSLAEEYVWRWFIYRQFEKLMSGRAAIIASALGFTAHHVVPLVAYFTWPVALLAASGVFIGGVVWSWLYHRYQSIWPGYLSHAIVDVPIFLIGYWLIF